MQHHSNNKYGRKNMKKTHFITMAAAAMLFSSGASAAPYTIANTFIAGTPAIAGQVNANFTAAKTAIDDNDARVTANAATAATNATNIAANTASAATNAANIATNTASAATNATAITALQLTNPVTTVINVPAGGAALANGTALMNAVAGITGSSPTNQFTVKLAVGTYDLGTQMLQLPDGTNLEGVAPILTKVTSAVPGTVNLVLPFAGTVRALGSSNISRVTLIASSLGANFPPGALNTSNGSVLLDQVELFGDIPIMVDGGTASTMVIQNSRVVPSGTRQIYENGVVFNVMNFVVLNSVFGVVGNTPGLSSLHHCFSSTYTNGTALNANCL